MRLKCCLSYHPRAASALGVVVMLSLLLLLFEFRIVVLLLSLATGQYKVLVSLQMPISNCHRDKYSEQTNNCQRGNYCWRNVAIFATITNVEFPLLSTHAIGAACKISLEPAKEWQWRLIHFEQNGKRKDERMSLFTNVLLLHLFQ